MNEDYKQKRWVFAQNMEQLINDDGINVKQILSLTKLIFIYMDTLINKITDFRHTGIITYLKLRNWNLTKSPFDVLCLLHRFLGPFLLRKILPETFIESCWCPSFFSGVKNIFFGGILVYAKRGYFSSHKTSIFVAKEDVSTQSMAVVSIGPLFLLMLIHATISCENFQKIKCTDNNFRPLLT